MTVCLAGDLGLESLEQCLDCVDQADPEHSTDRKGDQQPASELERVGEELLVSNLGHPLLLLTHTGSPDSPEPTAGLGYSTNRVSDRLEMVPRAGRAIVIPYVTIESRVRIIRIESTRYE